MHKLHKEIKKQSHNIQSLIAFNSLKELLPNSILRMFETLYLRSLMTLQLQIRGSLHGKQQIPN